MEFKAPSAGNTAKLYILRQIGRVPEVGKLAMDSNGVLSIPASQEDCINTARTFLNRLSFPLLCNEQKIEAGDKYLADDRNHISEEPKYSIRTCKEIKNGWIVSEEIDGMADNPTWSKKIILMPDGFPMEFLLEIVNGNVKQGNVISIEPVIL